MSAAHTPGPWAYQIEENAHDDMRHGVIAKCNDLWIAACYRSGTTPDNDKSPKADAEAEANARLIAATPDLLEALQAVAVGYRDHDIWLGQVRAAIAKATGATS